MDVKDGFRTLAALFTRHRKGPLQSFVRRVCEMYLTSYNNIDFDFSRNGERLILQRLAPFAPKVVFDVGANIGDWSSMAAGIFDKAAIHAFEIVPPTFQSLKTNVAGQNRITPHNVGLSDFAGQIDIAYFPNASCVSTTVLNNEVFTDGKTIIQGDVVRGDDFCREHGIGNIFFLKIDVEGGEPRVLEGFKSMLEAGNVDVIQFEYGLVSIYTKFMLKDMYALLEPLGFTIGKLYRTGVDFKPYDPITDENLMGPNYIACRKDRADLIEALRER